MKGLASCKKPIQLSYADARRRQPIFSQRSFRRTWFNSNQPSRISDTTTKFSNIIRKSADIICRRYPCRRCKNTALPENEFKELGGLDPFRFRRPQRHCSGIPGANRTDIALSANPHSLIAHRRHRQDTPSHNTRRQKSRGHLDCFDCNCCAGSNSATSSKLCNTRGVLRFLNESTHNY